MFGENDIANWAGRAAAGGPPPAEDQLPKNEAEEEGDEEAKGQHATVLSSHAQTLRDLAEVIKADVKNAMIDDALDMGEKDDLEECCEVLGAQADYLDGLAETASGREAEHEDEDEEIEAEDDDEYEDEAEY